MTELASIPFANWVLGIVAALIAAGVVSLWKLSNNVSQLQATVETWTKFFEGRFVGVTETTKEHGDRIGKLETRTAVHAERIENFPKRSSRRKVQGASQPCS